MRVPERGDVEGREDALVGKITIQVHLHVACALEFLKNHIVHPAARLDQSRGDDRQAAAFLNVAGRAEKALRLLQRVGLDAAAHDLAAARLHGVVGAGKASDRNRAG